MAKAKKLLYNPLTVFVLVLLIGAAAYFYQGRPFLKKTVQPQKTTYFLKSGADKDFLKLSSSTAKTALDATKEQADVKTKGEGENAYVIGINGIVADENKREYWSFYINGKMAEVGAGSYILKNGDKIEWKLKNY